MRQHVVIIGGTSGIGLGLVQYYLAQGHQVSTCGRDLNKIPSTLRTNPDLQAYRVDVTQPEQRSDFFDRVTQPIDLLFFCVGFYLNERVFDLDRASSQRMLSTNLLSFQACFAWAAEQMQHQEAGHLVTLSSVAGLIDYPNASLYALTKRAMLETAACYRTALAPFGIAVTVIASGYVDTARLRELNAGDASHKMFLISVDAAVEQIVSAVQQRHAMAIFPRQMRYLAALLNHLPTPILSYIMNTRR